MRIPYVLCVDVGSPRNVGWADSEGRGGTGRDLPDALVSLGIRLQQGEPVALGFEAPLWTPRRTEFERLTSSRGGVEKLHNRAWSAGAGCGALGAALVLMPWCLSKVMETSGPVPVTTSAEMFLMAGKGLLVWEAFVSASLKGKSTHHQGDAELAVAAFVSRLPVLVSDVPPEPSINHAAVALTLAGFGVAREEMGTAALVIAAAAFRGTGV